MNTLTIFRHSTGLFSRRLPLTAIRKSSTLESTLRQTLLSRPAHVIHDYLSPTPSHLLTLSLSDFLPPACHPSTSTVDTPSPHLPGRYDEIPLPQGHHLVYFPTQLPTSALLPDGTDALHSPGAPFHRRLWGGGSLVFNTEKKYSLDLDGTRAVCVEKITDVVVKGREGEEKVVVGVERKVGLVGRKLSDRAHDGFDEEWPLKMEERIRELEGEMVGGMDGVGLVERRELVFLRDERDTENRIAEAGKAGRFLKPQHERPDYSVALTPTPHLLFRFSALSFNAHLIHLNPQYCQEVEGYRNLLVHGPLSLVLMLSVLKSQLPPGEMVAKFEYRNLAPLLVGEECRVCVKRVEGGSAGGGGGGGGRWDVWIEGKGGGLAVRGKAVVETADAVRDESV